MTAMLTPQDADPLAATWPSWIDGYECGMLVGTAAGQADGYEAGRADGWAGGWEASDEHAALVHGSAHRVVHNYLQWTAGRKTAELQHRRGLPDPGPVPPVPPYAACLASWERPAKRREATA